MTFTRISYWKIFRLIFVIFSLYLMGDAFYRWDGFKYYGSFSEFLPSVALITIIWTTIAVFSTFILWLPIKISAYFCLRMGWRVRAEHLLLFVCIFLLLGVMVWIGKRITWQVQTTLQIKIAVLSGVTFAAIFLTYLFRNKSVIWIETVQERISPLVWLFGIWFVLSIPLVAYYTLGKQTDNVLQKNYQFSVEDKSRPNIIFVIFDALTARNMSVYGYHRPTTPFISKWAEGASLFSRTKAESNITTPTAASFMTGKRLWTHQTYHISGSKPVKSNTENLPLLLMKNGYYTMAFVANSVASVETLGISNSFGIAPLATEFTANSSLVGWKFGIIDVLLYRLFANKIKLHDWILQGDFILSKIADPISRNISKKIGGSENETREPPENVFNSFLKVIDYSVPEPFFAWIHILPPHYPYLPPAPYKGMFGSTAEVRGNQEELFKKIPHSSPQEMQPEIDLLRSAYDEFIRYCDEQFKEFIAKLKKRNRLKNTVIILSTDHGENFEHNLIGHTVPHLYEMVTHIPLIIKEPDQNRGRVISSRVEQIDIPATILDLAYIPVPSWMEGRSLVPLMRGKELPSRPAFSMELQKNRSRGHQITKGTIAVWEGDYKLIHYLESKKSLLFNLKEDPDELNNLFDKEPEAGQRLLALIQDNLKKANERISRGE